MTVDALIVGLGNIGMTYDLHLDPDTHVLSHARAMQLHPDFQLVGGVDPDIRRRTQFQSGFAAPAFATLEEALESLSPDLVIIAVPTELHKKVIDVLFSQSVPRAVLCEKPISYDPQDAEAIVQACEQRGVRLFVNYMRRCDPGACCVRQKLLSSEIAPPIKGVAWYSKGLLHNGSHLLNLLEYWLGDVADARILNKGRRLGDDCEPDVQFEFGRGAVLFLGAQEEHFSHYAIELVASNGRLRYERGGKHIVWQPAVRDDQLPSYRVLDSREQQIQSDMNRYQYHVADEIALALAGAVSSVCTGSQGLRTLTVLSSLTGTL